jgi:endonuclease/exonuclease/phosphatase family metal-dependent hydrolase
MAAVAGAADESPGPVAAPEGARVVRVATYNVHRCVGVDGKCDASRVAAVLRELDCDLIGLQEVDNNPGDAPASLQLDYLARATGMTAIPGLRLLRHRGHYGNALLTRHRVLGVRRHDLSFSWREPRGALDVDMVLDGIESRVIVTHLGLTPGERRHQMRRILALVGDTPVDEPLILLGDINEWLPLGRPLRWLHRLFGRPPHVRSFPSFLPMFALDRIWARPRGSLLEVSAHLSENARCASDHLPVVARWDVGSRRGARSAGSPAAPPG